jgi:hypothetical protein
MKSLFFEIYDIYNIPYNLWFIRTSLSDIIDLLYFCSIMLKVVLLQQERGLKVFGGFGIHLFL